MGRPRYKSGDQRARNKLVDAFWQLLGNKPYAKISALEICRTARLNKNTFYYHFACMDDLAAAAIDGLLLRDLLDAVLLHGGEGLHIAEHLDNDGIHVERLQTLLGPHGNALHMMLADQIAALWSARLEASGMVLSEGKRSVIAFASGGLVNAMRHAPLGDFAAQLPAVGHSELLGHIVRFLMND